MPENRQLQSNGSPSNSSVDNLEESVRRLRIYRPSYQDGGDDVNSGPYPDRPGQPDCIYYLRTGLCGYGSNCRFNHPISGVQGGQSRGELPERVGQPDCGYYIKTGTCKYGSTCKYHHPQDRHGSGPVPLNFVGLPMRQEERPCPFYIKTGFCKFGVACKFDHPQPASPGSIIPLTGPAGYGSPGSAIVPSSGLHFVGGVPALPLPNPPYLPPSHIQGPQTYMPVVVSPPMGIAPGQGWNTYMADSGSSGAIANLPERPDQPECRHFMSTGNCKYGSDCKYNHPRGRKAQLASNSLGPLGLPLRPGQAVCAYYNHYGLCKYGPTCKYDHPLAGYSYNYSPGSPFAAFHPSASPYHRNAPSPRFSEMSPKSSKPPPDWVKKPEAASNKSQKLDVEATEDSLQQVESPHSFAASSEIPHDQSD